MTKPPGNPPDLAAVLNNATAPDGTVGDGVALYSCGGPHFAPMRPPLGTVHYCAITEQTWVYEEDIGQEGWKVSNVTAHPAVAEKEDARIRAGLARLMKGPAADE